MAKLIFEAEKLKNVYSGLGQFCWHLGKELSQLDIPGLHFYLPESKKGMFGEKVGYITQKSLHKYLGVKTGPQDVFHAAHQGSKYFPSDKKTNYILTVHDLNFLYKYSGTKLKRHRAALQYRIDRAAAITAISHFVANDLRENMELHGKHIAVIHNGNSLNTAVQEIKPIWIDETPFLFTIGIVLPRKNFHVLLPMLKQLENYKLVIAGNADSPYGQEIRKTIEQSGLKDKLYLPGNISDGEKLWLYRHCAAFVFPSLAEGFGLPVVEAMSQGKPVFLNQATSLPEIGGKDAFYWNNFDPVHMAEVFEQGMQYFKTHELSNRYIQHAAQFTWEHAAKKYAQLYSDLRR